MERLIDMAEKQTLPREIIQMRIGGTEQKHHFVAVNFENPQIIGILNRYKELFKDDAEVVSHAEAMLQGKHADNYQYDTGSDFFPETLPGIRLRRPDGYDILKYERLTGKKVPRESRFDHLDSPDAKVREIRRPEPQSPPRQKTHSGGILAIIAIVIGFLMAGGYWFYRRKSAT